MTATQDQLDQLKRELDAENEKLAGLGEAVDAADDKLRPPRPPIDHPTDGGII